MTRLLMALPLFVVAGLARCDDQPPQTAEEWFKAVEARYQGAKTVFVKVEKRPTDPEAVIRVSVWYGGEQGYRTESLTEDGKVRGTSICDGKNMQELDAEGKPGEKLGNPMPRYEAWGRHHFVRRGYGWRTMETSDKEIPMRDLKLSGEEKVDERPCVVLEWTVLWAAARVTPIPQKTWIDKETLAIVRREWTVREGTVIEVYTDTKFDAEPPADAFRIVEGK